MELHIEHISPISLQLCLADPVFREGRVQANLRSLGELFPRKIDDLPVLFRYVKLKFIFNKDPFSHVHYDCIVYQPLV